MAAVRAIDAGGEPAVNVHKVAKEAGVTVPSLYHFYGSRDGLVEEAQVHRFEAGIRRVGMNLDEGLARATTAKKYREAIKAFLVGLSAPPNLGFRKSRATVVASAVNNPSLARRIAEIQETEVRRIASFLTYGKERGWVDRDLDIEVIVLWTITQLNGKIVLELDPRKKYLKEWDKLFIDSVLHALRFD